MDALTHPKSTSDYRLRFHRSAGHPAAAASAPELAPRDDLVHDRQQHDSQVAG